MKVKAKKTIMKMMMIQVMMAGKVNVDHHLERNQSESKLTQKLTQKHLLYS